MRGSDWGGALRDVTQKVRTRPIRILNGVALLAPKRKRKIRPMARCSLGRSSLCFLFMGVDSRPVSSSLDARFHVNVFFFSPTEINWRPLSDNASSSGTARALGWEAENIGPKLEIVLGWRPRVDNSEAALSVISYANLCPPPCREKESPISKFAPWKSVFNCPPYSDVVLSCCLWHIARTCDVALEFAFDTLAKLLPSSEIGIGRPRHRADLNKFSSHLQGVEDAIECVMAILALSPSTPHDHSGVLTEMARLRKISQWIEAKAASTEAEEPRMVDQQDMLRYIWEAAATKLKPLRHKLEGITTKGHKSRRGGKEESLEERDEAPRVKREERMLRQLVSEEALRKRQEELSREVVEELLREEREATRREKRRYHGRGKGKAKGKGKWKVRAEEEKRWHLPWYQYFNLMGFV